MKWKRAALAASALVVTASATAAGLAARRIGDSPGITTQFGGAGSAVALPPAVVLAKRPSVSDILDLILRERPAAADFVGSGTSRKGFPAGSEEGHVAGILRGYTKDIARADRIAAALVAEGRRRKVGSSLLVGIMLTENPWLDPKATSFVGARGLMQVMPFHAGNWGCQSRDLFDIESNICHGVAILADNLSRSRTLPQALLGYNGCVKGTNTPDCWKYPRKVYGLARKGARDDAGGRAFALPAQRPRG